MMTILFSAALFFYRKFGTPGNDVTTGDLKEAEIQKSNNFNSGYQEDGKTASVSSSKETLNSSKQGPPSPKVVALQFNTVL